MAVFSTELDLGLYLNPVDEPRERDIMSALISELNEKFNAGLDRNFSTNRKATLLMEEEEAAPPPDDVILVGSSHLAPTAVALRRLGENVNNMASPYWRLTEENVAAGAASLSKVAKLNPEATIIFQLYDSSIYFASSAPGEQALPRKEADGKYHICGELVLADWAAFRKIFYSSVLLLRAGGNNKKIILSPLPRYSTAKCCLDKSHITNFGKKGYGTSMGAALADIHGWVDDLARGKRIVNYEVVCPGSIIWEDKEISKKDLANFWGADPVHLTVTGYEKLAEKLAKKMTEARPRKRDRADSDTSPERQKPRLDLTRRLTRISRSDTVAERWGPDSGQSGRKPHIRKDGQSKYGAAGRRQ